jgi:hypothetical protein
LRRKVYQTALSERFGNRPGRCDAGAEPGQGRVAQRMEMIGRQAGTDGNTPHRALLGVLQHHFIAIEGLQRQPGKTGQFLRILRDWAASQDGRRRAPIRFGLCPTRLAARRKTYTTCWDAAAARRLFISICCGKDGLREGVILALPPRLTTEPAFGLLNWATVR